MWESEGKGGERGTKSLALLCTLQIYTTLVNGIALQEKSVARSERWGKGGERWGKRDEIPPTSLHIANLHHTSQWHSSSGKKCGKVGKMGERWGKK